MRTIALIRARFYETAAHTLFFVFIQIPVTGAILFVFTSCIIKMWMN